MSKRCNSEHGDILVSCSGTIGRVSLVPINLKSVLVRSVALIKPKRNIQYGGYTQFYLQSYYGQKQINESVNQGGQPNLFLSQIKNLSVHLPPTLAELEKIAEVLSDMDAEIEKIESKIEKYKYIKKGMMQKLLTGQLRLV